MIYFDDKLHDETVLLTVDFVSRLPAGATVTDGSTAITTWSGTDTRPQDVVNSVIPTVVGTKVNQMVTAGVAGVQYLIVFAAVLSDGETLEEQRLLRVVANR